MHNINGPFFFFKKNNGAPQVIHVDIGGHPPIHGLEKQFSILAVFSTVFRVPNFWGRFEALNDVFLGKWGETSMLI
jgi:hypothetical protein